MLSGYENTITELEKRIFDLIPNNPKILEIEDPFELFNLVKEFNCDDIAPSFAQARHALYHTQLRYKESLK
jgi:hypothetical protein